MEKPKPLQVQDFLLHITSQNTILTLEAEHEPTEKIFTINLDSDSIGQITNDLFDSVDRMVQGLKDATDDSFRDLSLTISPQGKLVYTAVYSSGVINKEFSFTLNLTEREMEPIEIFTRRLNSVKGELEKWKGIQENLVKKQETKVEAVQASQAMSEERSDRLENMMMQMEQKMTQFDRLENMMTRMEQSFVLKLEKLQKLYEDLKVLAPFKPDISFNNASVQASKFNLSDNHKTVTSISGAYSCLEILPQIPSSGQYSYSLRINSDVKNWTCFGITTDTGNAYWDENQNNYRYCFSDGKIYGRESQQPVGDGPFGGQDAMVKMVVDMDQGTLTFFVDDRRVNFCNISKVDRYFAYVGIGDAGDSVTLL